MHITQLMTSHRIMSCQSISYIVKTLDEYLTRLFWKFLPTLSVRCHGFHSVRFFVLATELFKTHYAV